MKAIVVETFGDPETMKIKEIPQPKPVKGEVLIKVGAAGVNPVDTYIRNGVYPLLPELPYTPGMDAAGTVVELGPDVKDFNIDDRVYYAGRTHYAYAEYIACPVERVFPLPDRIGFAQGASLGVPGAAAWRALFQRGKAEAGETVLIHGASGAAGLSAVQMANAAGLKVLGTAGTEKGVKLVGELGAVGVFNHNDQHYIEAIKTETAGKGINLIVEMLANVNLEKDLELLAPRGRVVIIGNRGRIEIDPRATMGKETEIRGVSLFNATLEESKQIHAAMIGAMKTGFYQPVVALELPLDQAPQAHVKVLESGNCGNIVLIPG